MTFSTKNKKPVIKLREIITGNYTVEELAEYLQKNFKDGVVVSYKIKFKRNNRIEQLTFPK